MESLCNTGLVLPALKKHCCGSKGASCLAGRESLPCQPMGFLSSFPQGLPTCQGVHSAPYIWELHTPGSSFLFPVSVKPYCPRHLPPVSFRGLLSKCGFYQWGWNWAKKSRREDPTLSPLVKQLQSSKGCHRSCQKGHE